MKLKEYNKALKKGATEDSLLVHVWHHKTVDTHFCAIIELCKEVVPLVEDYVTYLRPEIFSLATLENLSRESTTLRI